MPIDDNISQVSDNLMAVRFTPEMDAQIKKVLLEWEKTRHPVEILTMFAGAYALMYERFQNRFPPLPDFLSMIQENIRHLIENIELKKVN